MLNEAPLALGGATRAAHNQYRLTGKASFNRIGPRTATPIHEPSFVGYAALFQRAQWECSSRIIAAAARVRYPRLTGTGLESHASCHDM
jgi:hypothetical protein